MKSFGKFPLRGILYLISLLQCILWGTLKCGLELFEPLLDLSLYLSQPQAALAGNVVTKIDCRVANLPPLSTLPTPARNEYYYSSEAAQLQSVRIL